MGPATREEAAAVSDLAEREARLRPEFAHLYPGILPDRWDSAGVMADRVMALLLRRPNPGLIVTDRILLAEHFEFRGTAARPEFLPEGRTRRGESFVTPLRGEEQKRK
jgi:hypothetical protein